MFRRRELFLMLGVVGVDLDRAWRGSLEVAMRDLELATRNAVDHAGQEVIDARVVPDELAGTVLVDVRFSGDRAGAIAALERWRTTVPDVAGGSVILRTLLRGADVNLEWSDDEYDKELQARERSPEPESAPKLAAPDIGSARGSWLTDWQEATRHPWKTRMFLTAGFALLGAIIATLTGHLTPGSLAIAAVLGAVIGVAMGEYAMRAMRRLGAGDGRS